MDQPVVAGQTIAKVGTMNRDSMLHFELYANRKAKKLRLSAPKEGPSDKTNYDPATRRLRGLTDPTKLLDELAKDLVMVFTLEETSRA